MTDDELHKWETDYKHFTVVVGSQADGRENQGFTPIHQYSYERLTNQIMQHKVDQPDVYGLGMIRNTHSSC